METREVKLHYKPYQHQAEFHHGAAGKCDAVFLMARQHGKSECAIFEMIDRCLSDTTRSLHGIVFPFVAQARKNIWPRLKAALEPMADLCDFKETDLICTLPNGSRIMLLGADNEAARGFAFRGLLVDEFDNIGQEIWQSVFLPTQASFKDGQSWRIYIGTISRGRSRLFDLYNAHKDDSDWYCQITDAESAGLLSKHRLEEFRRIMGTSAYRREFLCDPNSPPENAVLGEQINDAKSENRILDFPYSPHIGLVTSWDLGFRDATAIWIGFFAGDYFNFIGYREYKGKSIPAIIADLKATYSSHYFERAILPHDIAVHEQATGARRLECFNDDILGMPEPVQRCRESDAVYSARTHLNRCRFHKSQCELGINRLITTEYATDNDGLVLDKIIHNDSSHAYDAFKYLAVYCEDRYPSASGSLDNQIFNQGRKVRVHRNPSIYDQVKPNQSQAVIIGDQRILPTQAQSMVYQVAANSKLKRVR